MNLTTKLKKEISKNIDFDQMLPDKLPTYVSSFVYMFGSLTMGALIVLIISGIIMVWQGPIWYESSQIGLFVRSIHFWGAQVFFFFMILHFLSNFFIAGWREGRILTWITGSLIFVISIIEAFTGFLIGGGFYAQWNQVQAKDVFSALGATPVFNVLNNIQMLGYHVVILPLVIVGLLMLHLFFIRYKGVVPPIENDRK